MREFLGLKPWRAHLLMTSMLIAALAPAGPARADETDAPMTLASIQVEQSPRRAELPVPKAAHQVYRLIAGSDEAISSGSAFLVSGKRVVVTSHHAVDRAKNYMLGFVEASGRVRTLGLNLLAAYPQKDLAILEAQEDLPGDALPLAVDYPELGSDLFAIGFPAAADQRLGGEAMQTADFFSPSVVKGSVSRIATDPAMTYQLQHQAPITQGYSGGPLIETTGVVIGVSSAVHKEAPGISYGVAASELASLLSACSLPHAKAYLSSSRALSAKPTAAGVASTSNQQLSPDKEAALKRANEFFRQGNIVGARYLFDYLARESQVPAAWQGLARTYDPRWLEGLTWKGAMADPGKAKEYYEKAARSGGDERTNGQPIRVATASNCEKSVCTLVVGTGVAPALTCRKTGLTP